MLENRDEVLEKIKLNGAPGDLLGSVLAAFGRKEKKGGLSTMRVNDLRWAAHRNGLDVDGSREMLIDALKDLMKIEKSTRADCAGG
jgi:hypothetical protein